MLEQLKDIALYLNFDMIGSPNPGYFTYDGDQSAPPEDRGLPRVPEGSAGIERTLVGYLKSQGKTAEDTSFDGRSDYDGFTMAGIPAGGLFTGADDDMTADQAKLWAATPMPRSIRIITRPPTPSTTSTGMRCASTVAGFPFAVGLYAQDIGGRNGDARPRRPHPSCPE